tara:strand:+ start:38215 stop:39612 length:1398 start_codon:yes stop_codon:yes gene_type:complete
MKLRTTATIVTSLMLGLALNGDVFAQSNQTGAAASDASALQERHEGMGRSLEDFFTAALAYSPQLQAAQGRWDIGGARRQAANGQLLPQINANASISDNRQDSVGGITEYRGERLSLQLRQVLFDWQVFSARDEAYLTENQFEAEYYAELSNVLTTVAERYLDVLQAQDALDSSETELDVVQEQLDQITRMHGLQMAQITDLYEAQARMAEVQAERQYLSSEVILTREALRSVSGLAVGELFTLGDNPDLPRVQGTLEEWVERASQQNHMINAREFAVEAAGSRISQARSRYMPRVNLIVQQQRSDLGFDNVPINRTDSGYVGVDVSVPLFAGGSNRAAVREANSMQSIARNELRQLHLEVSEKTRLYYLRMQALERQITAAEAVVQSREIASTSKQRGFELGTVTSVDVLDAVRNQFVAARELQRYRYDYIRLGLYLRRDAGTLTADDLLDIGSRLQDPASLNN